jgi:hypothetical protein
MKRIYVAGLYSANNVLDVLKNIGRGQKVCAFLFRLGFAPFCPWHDKTYVMDFPENDYTVQKFYDFSLTWLKVCDGMFIISGEGNSKGVNMEIKKAKEWNIPIFRNIEDLLTYYND